MQLPDFLTRHADGEIRLTGHRIGLLRDAISPLADRLPAAAFDRLAKALSLLFGIEAVIILKDIWGVQEEEVTELLLWAADLLIEGAQQHAA